MLFRSDLKKDRRRLTEMIRKKWLQGVENTFFTPLAARSYASKRFPESVCDEKASSLGKIYSLQNGVVFEKRTGATLIKERAFSALQENFFQESCAYKRIIKKVVDDRKNIFGVAESDW